ncbi:MAG: Thiol-disulfide isomerase or thioredoxin [Chitinophagaceae bacterium]|nr:Thiol-disulfide isomerase or thioredoxin [Chitinophagaceae bacterium]
MKRLFLFLALAICTNGFSQTGKEFIIKGSIEGQDDGSLVLNYPGVNGKVVRDTAYITKGNFRFKGMIAEPAIAGISGKTISRGMSDPNFTTIFIEPAAMEVKLKANDFKNAVVKGSRSQEEYTILNLSRKRIEEKYQKQLDSLRTEKDHEKNAEVRERLAPYFRETDKDQVAFFRAHPRSYVTAYMLRMHIDDLSMDSLQFFYKNLGPVVQQSAYGKEVATEIMKLQAGSPGSTAKEFTTVDINGNTISLAGFKGKYVLIDFWASWCVPCRKGSPHLKELYAKYKSRGMEIIGIADDDRAEDAWRKAIEKDGTGIWKHVRRGMKMVNGEYDHSNDINEKFGIHTLPTRILLDPNGRIVGRFGEQEDELDKMLMKIFGA